MPFQIVHNDICHMKTEAIVNAANPRLLMGGGVCGAIFKAAGASQLQQACNQIGYCPTGKAVITKGYDSKAKYIIHAVGPIWEGGTKGEATLLASAYTHALELAKEKKLSSIAFPLLSAGIYGYPKEDALKIATSTIKAFLENNEMSIYLVVYDRKAVTLSETLYNHITHYIDYYFEDRRKSYDKRSLRNEVFMVEECMSPQVSLPINAHLETILHEIEESFSETLLRLIDEKGYTDVEVYKKANIDRKLFSKIRTQKAYLPKKTTVLALAIALELSLEETKALLEKAGYALTMSHKGDVIIRFFIEHQQYDLFTINQTLFYFEQPLLGSA